MVERFWVIVYDEMHRNRLGLALGCESELSGFIAKAMANLTAQTASTDDVRKAEADFRKYVQAMAADAILKGYPQLHEDTFFVAKKLFCPGMWPFC